MAYGFWAEWIRYHSSLIDITRGLGLEMIPDSDRQARLRQAPLFRSGRITPQNAHSWAPSHLHTTSSLTGCMRLKGATSFSNFQAIRLARHVIIERFAASKARQSSMIPFKKGSWSERAAS